MSHLINTMAFSGQTPWHGLGNQLDARASLADWVVQAGLTWTAEHTPVAFKTVAGEWKQDTETVAVVRSDTNERFCYASQRRKELQPRQVLEFFRNTAATHNMELETAGALKSGEIVWALATNKNASFNVGGVDKVLPYLLLSTSYDGSQAHRAYYTTVRVVCNNTMQMSLSDKTNGVSIRHTATFNEVSVKQQLRMFKEEAEAFEATANMLATKAMSYTQTRSMLESWFGSLDEEATKKTGKPQFTTKSLNVISDIERCIVSAPGQSLVTAKGTAWGILNGITNYIDFAARARNDDNRLTNAWFGRGVALKAKAAKELIAA